MYSASGQQTRAGNRLSIDDGGEFMNWRTVLALLVAGVAIGILAFLLRMTQAVDTELHRDRQARLAAIDSLDVALNRAFTQTSKSAAQDPSTDRAAITAKLGEALDAIDKNQGALRGLAPELDKTLDSFLDTIDNKFEMGADFEARNSLMTNRLINSMDAVPTQAAAVLALADPLIREPLEAALIKLKAEIVTVGVSAVPENAQTVSDLLAEIELLTQPQAPTAAATAADTPAAQAAAPAAAAPSEAFKEAVAVLRSRCREVLADKSELVDKLRAFLDRPTGPQLRALQDAYNRWYEGEVAVANQYRIYLAAYAGILLLVLGYLGYRLSRSYRELDRANDELSHANEHLEVQVVARTKDLSSALQDLKSSQSQLIQSEKMASLGQMVAGVAHEINTPLGYARSNAEIVRNSLEELGGLVSAQDRALSLLTGGDASDEQVAEALGEAEARRQSLDPRELLTDLNNLLRDTDHGLLQIADLVSSLKDFSRVDRSREDLFDVNQGIESALKIAHNQLKHRVEVVKQYGQLPQIQCSPSKLNQVFLNLFTNAAQAIDGSGKIYVHTAAEKDGVAIRVLDTGCGMSEEVRARIFEPFFTTKPVGKGTGLGLSIVFRIIEEHGGRIEVRSQPAKGSEFIIQLPLRQTPLRETAPPDAQPLAELATPALAVA